MCSRVVSGSHDGISPLERDGKRGVLRSLAAEVEMQLRGRRKRRGAAFLCRGEMSKGHHRKRGDEGERNSGSSCLFCSPKWGNHVRGGREQGTSHYCSSNNLRFIDFFVSELEVEQRMGDIHSILSPTKSASFSNSMLTIVVMVVQIFKSF